MTDPYKVLGVSPNATDEQIKEAYRELARKYHPDSYQNNPLADLASEKMKEVNEAYDSIMKMRRNSGSARSGGTSGAFSDVRRLINQNRLVEAEELLGGVPSANRDAEWYFLKGSVFYSRGWLDEAFNHFAQACRMNPNNPEYTAAYNNLMWQRQTGRPGTEQGPYRQPGNMAGGCSACDMCSGLICADCCCECMGGDLIRCC
ncbi:MULTISPECIES: J domain-containing protein [Oscillospiraceae]|uniref:DnaJ-like protein n=1 Tax=Harryflintia acetispora TaxID=1849041 RepID=A0A9X8Y8W0_9FIRM|nr:MULTISPECIES: J domain-containing protein [Oscillospiraceae]RGB69798.1 molecular chaperone DnaJ [Harryflintia acetispora]TCL44637.1 DnaJ-like protein [Harryflintia acetispora]